MKDLETSIVAIQFPVTPKGFNNMKFKSSSCKRFSNLQFSKFFAKLQFKV